MAPERLNIIKYLQSEDYIQLIIKFEGLSGITFCIFKILQFNTKNTLKCANRESNPDLKLGKLQC